MQKHQDNLASRINGNALQPLSGVTVTVTDDATGLPAALYSDDGVTPITASIVTDDNGGYSFYAADGKYTVTFTGVRLSTPVTRKIILEDPDDNPAASLAQLAAAGGGALVKTIANLTGAIARTVQAKHREDPTITDASTIVADGTDQTAAIVAWLGTLDADFTGMIRVPDNVKFVANTVYDALPKRAILIDHAGRNSWDTTGSRARVITLGAEKGDPLSIVDLTTVLASSGHNASTGIDNRGTAGSASANKLVAAFHWFSGRLSKGQPGLRQIARWEWLKLDGTTTWVWAMRKFVPWLARNWEYWTASTVWAAGATVLTTTGKTYSTTLGGTSGADEPSHTSGTAVDGTVTWQYISSSNDASIFVMNENGEIATNTSPSAGVSAYLKGSIDSSGTSVIIAEGTGVSKTAELRLYPTSAASEVITAIPRLQALDDSSLRLRASDTSADGFQSTNARPLQIASHSRVQVIATDLATTPSITNCGCLIFTNTGATSVTNFTGGVSDHEFMAMSENANTTIVNSASVRLKGGVNAAIPTNGIMIFKKTTRSSAWNEVSRNF